MAGLAAAAGARARPDATSATMTAATSSHDERVTLGGQRRTLSSWMRTNWRLNHARATAQMGGEPVAAARHPRAAVLQRLRPMVSSHGPRRSTGALKAHANSALVYESTVKFGSHARLGRPPMVDALVGACLDSSAPSRSVAR